MNSGAYREIAVPNPSATSAALRAAADSAQSETRATLLALGDAFVGLASGRVVLMLAQARAAVVSPQSLSELHAAERARVLAALNDVGWNRGDAARALGMSRRTFYRRMAEYGLLDGAKPRGVNTRRRRAPGGRDAG